MNGLLPLLLFALSAMQNGKNSENEMLNNIIKNFLPAFGSENAELISSLLTGKADIKSLMPVLIKTLTSKKDEQSPDNFQNGSLKEQNNCKEELSELSDSRTKNTDETITADTPNYLKPITDIANERINFALAHYFSNN